MGSPGLTIALNSNSTNRQLPSTMIEEILSRLPVKSLCRFKCVSKPWSSLISDNPSFVASHLYKGTLGRIKMIYSSEEEEESYLLMPQVMASTLCTLTTMMSFSTITTKKMHNTITIIAVVTVSISMMMMTRLVVVIY
ncbi:unnamed protein product [Prunus brigantina]